MLTKVCIPYNTRSSNTVEIDDNGNWFKKLDHKFPATKTVSYGLQSIRYLGPKI